MTAALLAVAIPSAATSQIELAVDIRTRPNPPSFIDIDFTTRPLVDVNGVLLFMAEDGVHGLELWRSDGTREGTSMVRDICPGSSDALPE